MKIKITLLALVLASFNMLATNYYWVGGSGNWSDYVNHWATSSGGSTFHIQMPQSTDNVFFNALSFTAPGQTVTVDQVIVQCADMNWTGVTNTPEFNGTNTLKIYGSLTLTAGMEFDFLGNVNFEAITPGKIITTNGTSFGYSTLVFNGIGGGWTLQDTISANTIYLNNGTLNTNNKTINASTFYSYSNSPRTLIAGTSTFNMSGNFVFYVNSTGITMSAASSTIRGVGTSQEFIGGGLTYNDLFFNGTGQISDSYNTFHNISFASDGLLQYDNTAYNVDFGGNGNIYGGSFHDVSFGGNATILYGATFNNVTIAKNGNIGGGNSIFNNLSFSPGYTYTLAAGKTQTINGSLNVNGSCGALISISSSSTTGVQAGITKTSGAITASYVTLHDINATGGAAFTANNSVNLGNNTGWTISSLQSNNLYWVGNGGNWDDGSHWSTTSGGIPSGCSPTSMDNVFFDGNSFSIAGQTVNINTSTAFCKDMVWTGVFNAPALSGSTTLKIYGSLALAAGMNFNFTGNVNFEATTTGKTIASEGTSFGYSTLFFNGIGGEWILQDALTSTSIYLNNGTLNTNNKTVNAISLYSYGTAPRALTTGTSTFNLSGYYLFYINPIGMTMSAANSIIRGTTSDQQFIGGGLTYNDLFFNGTGQISDSYNTLHDVSFASTGLFQFNNNAHDVSFGGDGNLYGGSFHDVSFGANSTILYGATFNNVVITKNGNIGGGSNTFNDLTFSPGYTYIFEAGQTQTINGALNVNGNCSAMMGLVKSSTNGSQATIAKPSGSLTVSYVTLQNINATGGATFIANNAIDLGNNSGWIINAQSANNLYWIGNSGNWNDGSHWSTTSGGPASGCPPTSIDNIFFDANSFTLPGQTVTINIPTASCNNMTWTGVTNTPSICGSTTLKIFGSLTLATGMAFNFTGNVNFEATTTGKTITTAGTSFGNSTLVFNGTGGDWTLQDALTSSAIYLNNGTLNTNNKTINATTFYSLGTSTRSLIAGTSTFNMSGYDVFFVSSTGLTMNAASSTINATAFNQQFIGGGLIYNNLFFTGIGQISDSYNTFHNISFASYGLIQYNNNAHDVSFVGDGNIYGGNFHDVSFGANATMLYGATFNNVTIAKNGNIGGGNNTFNNLSFSPGYTYILGAGQTQTVTNICAQGTGALPIRIQSSSAGVPATISKANGTLCWEYVLVSDIKAMGGAIFNAGLAPVYSHDMGGNSGFLFTGDCFNSTCMPCVTTSITSQPTDNEVCSGSDVVFATAAIGTALTYQWQVNQGAGFVNLSNTNPYSGADTKTLTITSVANGFNGYIYRCNITSACGSISTSNIGILTVNALPNVSSSVNFSTVTISATGGMPPYSGTGSFTESAIGSYSYTIMDAKGCSAATTAVVTEIADLIAPIAICKNATVTLSNGNASITPNDINNGSYDNVGITSITVAPNTFSCANIGANTVTLTVKDNSGNTTTCQSTVTVAGSVPTVSISQGAMQGSAVALIANASAGVSYLWDTGEITSSKNVSVSGTSTVTVTNIYGCSATASFIYSNTTNNLFSTYTIIAKKEAKIREYSYVQTGGVGVTKTNGEIEVANHSTITGSGTFAKAVNIVINPTSTITDKFYVPAVISLPLYKANPYCQSSSDDGDNRHNGNSEEGDDDDNNHHNDDSDNDHHNENSGICNQSNKNKTVANNTTVSLNDSIYSKITIGNNATVTFTQPVVYIKSLTVGAHAKIEFSTCTEIRICGEIELGEYCIFNSEAKGVFVYCDENVQIKKGSSFTGSIYSLKEIETKGASSARVTMKGMFIGEKVESKFTTWNFNETNNDCYAAKSVSFSNNDELVIIVLNDNMEVLTNNISAAVYPNPSTDNFNLVVTSDNTTKSIVSIYDINGKLLFTNDKVEVNSPITFGGDLTKGVYLLTVSQGNVSKTVRIVKTE